MLSNVLIVICILRHRPPLLRNRRVHEIDVCIELNVYLDIENINLKIIKLIFTN